MLKSIKNVHLGDLVNILQIYHDKDELFFVPETCKCCGANTRDTLRQLLTLFNTKLRLTDQLGEAQEVFSSWTQSHYSTGTLTWRRKPYVKAVNLPSYRGDHVACQFDARSKPNWTKTIGQPDIDKLIKIYGSKLINIGDRPLPVKDGTKLSVLEKFEILATARKYIGIDSGISHLALMTRTPSYILHQGERPWFFYPEDAMFVRSDSLLDLFIV